MVPGGKPLEVVSIWAMASAGQTAQRQFGKREGRVGERSISMKILIVTIGTRGDVQPYVALGRALKGSGVPEYERLLPAAGVVLNQPIQPNRDQSCSSKPHHIVGSSRWSAPLCTMVDAERLPPDCWQGNRISSVRSSETNPSGGGKSSASELGRLQYHRRG